MANKYDDLSRSLIVKIVVVPMASILLEQSDFLMGAFVLFVIMDSEKKKSDWLKAWGKWNEYAVLRRARVIRDPVIMPRCPGVSESPVSPASAAAAPPWPSS